jgi:hypothetical protein
MVTAAQEQELIEQALNEPPNETVAAPIELAQADHAADVARQIAQGEYLGKRRDETQAWLEAQQNENIGKADAEGFVSGNANADEFVSPDVQPTKPRRLRKRYVKRDVAWIRAKDPAVRLKIGEAVFVRTGSAYERMGHVTESLDLPKAYLNQEAA